MFTFMNLGVITGLDYYVCTFIKLKSALNISYDATLSADICDIMCSHKIRAFTIHFMCEYFGIRLTSYEKK